ncbi:MAG: prolyl oligopeptidase family serine peptidase [Prevotella sp.]|nr:prolyl oligopeptidase family serine peptidase [Prevotella sp.]
MKKTKLLLALAMAVLTSAPAAGQKKSPVEKRERFEFSFDLPAYVEQLKQELTYPLSWENSGIKSFRKWQKKARQRVFDCMMTPPRAADAWDMKIVAEEQRDGYRALRIAFNQNAYARTEALVLVPDGEGPFPAVNLLHDHGAHLYIGKEKMIRPFGVEQAVIDDADAWAKNLYGSQYVGDYLARHGYVCFSADAPMWGERGREEGVDRSKYDIIAGNMMMLGRDLCGFMHYDDIAATEFLATLPWVDPQRIGCMGCSMGAYRAWMLSALSDRIRASAAICWMVTTDVQMSTADGKREYGGFANCLPGLRQWLDYPDIASLAAPKPMLFINGTQDHLFPVRGVKKAFEQMHQTWRRLGADERLTTELWDVPHSCGVEIQKYMLDFFNRNL